MCIQQEQVVKSTENKKKLEIAANLMKSYSGKYI